MSVNQVNAHDYVFPVLGTDHDSDPSAGYEMIRTICGTAFSLSDGVFMTSAHALTAALRHEFTEIAYVEDSGFLYFQITEHEVLTDIGVALFRANIAHAKAFPWQLRESALLDRVQTIGHPYGLNIERFQINLRAFEGSIVSTSAWPSLPGGPRIYELSLPCPRGLSGSFLLSRETEEPSILGMIFGNIITQMTVYGTHGHTATGSELIYEKAEPLHLGVAIQTTSIAASEPKMLGYSVRSYLKSRKLLVD